ncbi:unnamed protein product [Rotaria magnacalcarata]|uniref:Cytochrome b561 domain-containing protein n=1 Tax=Rotaria magnacalcarata TaxID=392030 RepID=A0A816QBY2_9BILA|nr:unnamed protein product [Rotaria magnacalcarata]CAF1633781.1 unnamed protein product [Rotaria magnacalcarata]CAF1908630.1 unnamed protein product [Rotaria magnacalcarata]CAF2058096.1 unnamed protein product [Rotaria magnacalcarata]CAF2157465.1 unnamed protein product [Rotaria magnacalcarata]
MNSPWYIGDPSPSKDESLVYAHGTIMVISWMLLASTGILFARYGRHLRISGRRKLLGDTIWFQLHRFILCMVTVATLLGFFLILIKEKGQWVSVAKDGGHIFAHSVLGAIIVCCALLQAWLALFRCNTDSSFRQIFNWLHRSMGYLAFFLSIPTIFLIVTESKVLPMQQDGLIAILSLWSAWIVIVVILFEIVEYRDRLNSKMGIYRVAQNELMDQTTSLRRKMDHNDGANIRSLNEVKLFLFLLHIIVAISLTIPLVVIIWRQN